MNDQSAFPEFVFVIDDEQTTRRQIESLLTVDDIRMQLFDSIVSFLDWLDYDRLPDNLLIAAEINLTELGGLDLLNILKADEVFSPTVLMGSSLSVNDAVEAMHAGANYILQKPFSDGAFRVAINRAVHARRSLAESKRFVGPAKSRLSSLSPRQRELLIHVSKGRTNKEIAHHLSISPKTVELHRAAMMQKMGASSLAELIRIAVECDDILFPGVQHECA